MSNTSKNRFNNFNILIYNYKLIINYKKIKFIFKFIIIFIINYTKYFIIKEYLFF